MFRLLKKLAGACLCFLFLQSCVGQYKSFEEMADAYIKNTVPLIYTEDLSKKLKLGQKLYILDAREREEFEQGSLPGARYIGYKNIAWDALDGIDNDAELIVFCSVGYRSERIGEKLQKKGYKKIYNLYGGIFDWINKDEKVISPVDKQEVSCVHPYSKTWAIWLEKGKACAL